MEREKVWSVTARPVARDWWETHRSFQAGIFGLLLLLLAVFAHAQDAPIAVAQSGFACKADAGWIVNGSDRLVPEAARPEELPIDARPITISGFDAAKYGFTAVDFYAVTGEANQDGAPMSLFLHLAGENSGRWYRYSETPTVVIRDSRDEDNQELLPIAVAAPQTGVPLFHLGYYGNWSADNRQGMSGDVLVMDLRGKDPQVAEHLNCTAGAPQAGVPQTTTSCEWNALRGDYACNDSSVLDASWTRRKSTRRYWLLEDEDAYARPAGEPKSVADLAAKMARGRFKGDRATVEGVGEVRLLATWLPGGDGRRVYLFASRGAGDQMTARVFAASVDSDGEGSISETPIHDLTSSGLSDESAGWEEDEFPSGDRLSYLMNEVAVNGALRVLEVQVNEGAGQGVFWIAVDTSKRYLQADGIRISAETLVSGRGTVLARDEGASSAQVIPGETFSAALQIARPATAAGVVLAKAPERCAFLLSWSGRW